MQRSADAHLQALMSSLEQRGAHFNEALDAGEHLLLASTPAKRLVQVCRQILNRTEAAEVEVEAQVPL